MGARLLSDDHQLERTVPARTQRILFTRMRVIGGREAPGFAWVGVPYNTYMLLN